ncbi:universal stress protein [Streptomyces sp. DH37]|uniref:universal stress protein n=1 Tax=Streptomyces sp. DH37 TaxID=3040122 RepID=UPI0024420338|nr:universal stress protein [Streptomyces sp. DH37]MDG9705107.1 universal stress protein [Streptomyces sp. DH37]
MTVPHSPPRPIAAVLTDRLDDVAVADTAVRLARTHQAPLLLVAVLPAHAGDGDARAVLARVLPRVGPAGLGHIPAAHRLPPRRDTRLRTAAGLLALACRNRCDAVVAARTGPAGLDAAALREAAALRGGPPVHTTVPASWAPPRATARRPLSDAPESPGTTPR